MFDHEIFVIASLQSVYIDIQIERILIKPIQNDEHRQMVIDV